MLKKVVLSLSGLLLFVAVVFIYLWNARDTLAPFDQLYLEAHEGPLPAGAVYVQFLGNTNLLISDGHTHILTDGWFSRPSIPAMAFSAIEPDRRAIAQSLATAGITRLDAVIPVHSHFDHAMDAPLVAEATGGLLIGSESTLNIGRGLKFPEQRMRLAVAGEAMAFGDFTVTLIKSRHYRFPGAAMTKMALSDPVIEQPLVPPVRAFSYKEGGSYSIHVDHPRGSLLLHASAGAIDGALEGVEVDTLFLGVGGIAAQTAEYQHNYWQQTVHAVKPRQVIPVHWDSMSDALEDEPIMPTLFISLLWDYRSSEDLAYTRDKTRIDGIHMALAPMWAPLLLFPN